MCSLLVSLAYEVYYNQMEDDVSKYEISKGSFGGDAFEQPLVVVVALKPEAHWSGKDEKNTQNDAK